jgi:hypothetical protein
MKKEVGHKRHPRLGFVSTAHVACLRHHAWSKIAFLDIILTKGSSILLHAFLFTVDLFYWRIKKTYSSLVLKSLQKICEKQENSSLAFLERKNEGRKSDKNSNLRRLEFIKSQNLN